MFDRYVEERQKPGWYRRSLIGASIVTHGILALFLLAITLFEIDEIRPPSLAIVFFKEQPPPPPLPPAFGKKRDKPPEHPTIKPRVHRPAQPIVQPVEKPPEPKPEPPKEEEEEEEGDPEGVEGGSKEGVTGGRLDGVEGGVLGPSGAVGLPAAPAPPPKPKVVAQFIFDRERVKYPDPHLPEGFVASHAHQMVRGMYRICVDVDGQINKMETITSLSGADQAIIEQVSHSWLYNPQPLPVCTIRVFEFHIN